MRNWIGVSAAGLLAAVAMSARAEPAPAPAIDPGRYDTPWGAGEMRIVGATAIFTLDDGSVFWGSLGNGGREWNGRWVRAPQSARADRAHRPCSGARGPVPSSFPVPSGGFWGRFAAHSLRSNGPRGAAQAMVSAAFDGGSDDNISVAIAEYGEVPRGAGRASGVQPSDRDAAGAVARPGDR